MNRKWVSSVFLPLLGMICTLAFAYGCSILNQALIDNNARTFQIFLILPLFVRLTSLLSIGGAILLFWGIMTRTSQSKWTGWIFLLVGLVLVSLPNVLFYNLSLYPAFQWGYPLFYTNFALGNSPYYEAKVGVAVIGLLILILPKPSSNDRDRSDILSQPPKL